MILSINPRLSMSAGLPGFSKFCLHGLIVTYIIYNKKAYRELQGLPTAGQEKKVLKMISNEIRNACFRIARNKKLDNEQKNTIINEIKAFINYANNEKCDQFIINRFNIEFKHFSIILSRTVCDNVKMTIEFSEQVGYTVLFYLQDAILIGLGNEDFTDYDELDIEQIFGYLSEYLIDLIDNHSNWDLYNLI